LKYHPTGVVHLFAFTNLLGDTWEMPPTKTTATDFELVIGKATALFPRDGSTERQVEAALGNLVADAMRARYGTQLATTACCAWRWRRSSVGPWVGWCWAGIARW
jgi:hypothetical protein